MGRLHSRVRKLEETIRSRGRGHLLYVPVYGDEDADEATQKELHARNLTMEDVGCKVVIRYSRREADTD